MKAVNLLIFFIISIFTLQNSVQAQITVTGTVKDEKGVALEFANVILRHIESGDLKGISTDVDGKFALKATNSGAHELSINYIGYSEWKQEINLTESIDIGAANLEPDANTLGEALVTGEKVIIEKRKDKLVFNVDQSTMSQGYDGVEILKRSPNVVISGESGIMMRNETARLLVNGKQINLTGEDLTSYIRTIPSENIKSIEVQTHQTTSTDAATTGGVVNIILKKKPMGLDGGVRTYLGLQANEQYFSSSGINLNYGAENWNVYGAFSLSHQLDESVETFDIDYIAAMETYESASLWDYVKRRKNYNVGMVIDIAPKHTLGVEFSGADNEKDVIYSGNQTLSNPNNLLLKGSYIIDGYVENGQKNATLNYTWKIDPNGGNLKFYVDYTNQDLLIDERVDSKYSFGDLEDGSNINTSSAVADIYFAQADLEKNLVNDFKLNAGLKYTQIERDNSFDASFLSGGEWITNNENSSAVDFTEKISAGFFTLSKKVKEKNFVKVGLRVENTNLLNLDNLDGSKVRQNYTDYFPSLFVSHDLDNGNIISFNFIKSLTRPNFGWLNNKVVKLNDFRYEIGTPDLRPQYHYDFELSLKQKKQSFTTYYRIIDEAIIDIYELRADNAYYYQYLNLGTQHEVGIEYNHYGNLFDWWYLKGTASVFYRGFKEDTGFANFNALGAYANFTSSFTLSETMNLDILSWYYTRYRMPYFLGLAPYQIDVMLRKKFFNKNLIVRLDIIDIFDLYAHRERRTYPENTSEWELTLRLRMIRLGLSYNFSSQSKASKRKNASKNEARYRF